MVTSLEKNSFGCPKYPCGRTVCKPVVVPIKPPTPPVSNEEKDLEKHSCIEKPILTYDSCDAKLPIGKMFKEKGHTFKNVKGVVSLAVPEGCKVTLYTEAIRSEALYADKASHAAI